MIDLAKARERVTGYLRQSEIRMNSFGSALPDYQDPKHQLVVVREQEYDFGWVFSYDTRKFVDSGNLLDSLVGNLPLIVDRGDGQIYEAAVTPNNFDRYIEEYRKGKRTRLPRTPRGQLS
jgi:hypothetical protein